MSDTKEEMMDMRSAGRVDGDPSDARREQDDRSGGSRKGKTSSRRRFVSSAPRKQR